MNRFFVLFAALILLFGCTSQQPAAAQKEDGAPSAPVAKEPSAAKPSKAAPEPAQTPPPAPSAKTEPSKDAPAMNEPTAAEQIGEPKSVPNPLENIPSNLGWKVSYEISGSTMPGKTLSTQYLKGSKFRMDSEYQSIQTRSYLLDGAVTTCTNAEGSWMCFKTATELKSVDDSLKESSSGSPVYADGSMAIAGTSANCFKTSSKDGNVRYCLSPESVPLYIKTDGQADGVAFSAETRATSYSMQVSDSDFVLPASASSMPSLPSGFGG